MYQGGEAIVGRGEAVSAYVSDVLLFEAGDKVTPVSTPHSSSSFYKGDGGYIVGRGENVTGIITDHTLFESGGTVTKIGTAHSSGTLYRSGTSIVGRGTSVDAYVSDVLLFEAGEKVNQIGTSHSSKTRYKGDGSSVTGRGSGTSYSISGSQKAVQLYAVSSSGSYTCAKGNTLTYYTAPSSKTLYPGNGSSVTGRGTSVSAIDYDGTLYEAGTQVTKIGTGHTKTTLYKGDGTSGYLRGTAVDAIEYNGTLYEAGTEVYARGDGVKLTTGLYKGNGTIGYLRGDSVQAIEYNGTLYEEGDTVRLAGSLAPHDVYYRDPTYDKTYSVGGSKLSVELATVSATKVTALTV